MPHSMSALEAIYWAYTYPDEVRAIVGLDMAVPEFYKDSSLWQVRLMKAGVFFGFHRFPVFNPVSSLSLTEKETKQNQLLNERNSLNGDVYEECRVVLENAEIAGTMDISSIPLLMFATNYGGGNNSTAWMAAQEDFASKMKECTQIKYQCGHNLYYYKSGEMSDSIKSFLKNYESY